jgi:hypothetical protein
VAFVLEYGPYGYDWMEDFERGGLVFLFKIKEAIKCFFKNELSVIEMLCDYLSCYSFHILKSQIHAKT